MTREHARKSGAQSIKTERKEGPVKHVTKVLVDKVLALEK